MLANASVHVHQRIGSDMSLRSKQFLAAVVLFFAGMFAGSQHLVHSDQAGAAAPSIPTGGIIMFDGGKRCPAGFVRFSNLDGRFARGGTHGAIGGEASHSHSIAQHSHSLVGPFGEALARTTVGKHGNYGGTIVGFPQLESSGFTPPAGSTANYHGHDVEGSTAIGGPSLTGSSSSLPPFRNMTYCRAR